jgi:hypothetical protein
VIRLSKSRRLRESIQGVCLHSSIRSLRTRCCR